jgi:DNA-binding NarL/FixJ family response regulator
VWLQRSSLQAERGRLVFEADAELGDALRHAARVRGQEPERLASDLLQRALAQEVRETRARAALASLTPRQQEVARLAARGQTNRQIARALVVSPETVKTHVRHTLDKFGLRSKTELRLMLLDVPEEHAAPTHPSTISG